MADNEVLKIVFDGDVSGLSQATRSAEESLTGLGGVAQDVGNFISDNMQQAAIAAGIVFAGLTAATKSALDQASAYQQDSVAFTTMLGNAQAAKDLLKEVSDFAAKTPFELPNVVDGAKSLLAFGVAAKDIIPTFSTLGNIAAGVGVGHLPDLIHAFGQVKAAGQLSGIEVREFVRAGVPLISELADHFGVAKDKINEMITKGKVSFDDFNASLQLLGGSGGKWGDLMVEQSKTFSGIMSNVSDEFGRLTRNIIGIDDEGQVRKGSIFAISIEIANKFLDTLDSITPVLTDFVSKLLSNKDVVAGLLGAIGGLLVSIGVGIAIAFGPAIILMASITAAFALLAVGAMKLIDALGGVNKVMQEMQAIVTVLTAIFNTVFKPVIDDIINTFVSQLLPALKVFWAEYGPEIITIAKTIGIALGVTLLGLIEGLLVIIDGGIRIFTGFIQILNALAQAPKAVENAFVSLWNTISNIWGKISGLLSNPLKVASGISSVGGLLHSLNIPGFATGGVVPGPIGQPMLAVVHGGETVVPNKGSGASNVGAVTVNFNGDINANSQSDLDNIVNAVKQALGRENDLARYGAI